MVHRPGRSFRLAREGERSPGRHRPARHDGPDSDGASSPPLPGRRRARRDRAAALSYGEDEKGRFAIYRLRKKEALYSAVVVRFTGRVHAADVIELANAIAVRSGVDDVHAIPVGYPIRIPLDVLSEEYLPPDDPRGQALAREKAEAAQFAMPAQAKGLSGVRVVLDAGHGGRDTGTIQGGIWEATYVYDVAVRLRKILMERTRAEVVLTTRDEAKGWKVVEKDRLPSSRSQSLLTNPRYDLSDPLVGVNLRWYLANSLLNRPGPVKKKIPPERTVFISIHADSLHPSLRGAMVYVPGERFLRDRYGKHGAPFPTFREWREQPVVSFSRRDRVASEGASTALAGKIVAAMRRSGLEVHPFSPVRTHVIRAGREWVPAVLRYNQIPSRVLARDREPRERRGPGPHPDAPLPAAGRGSGGGGADGVLRRGRGDGRSGGEEGAAEEAGGRKAVPAEEVRKDATYGSLRNAIKRALKSPGLSSRTR